MRIISFNIRYTDDPNGHSIAERAPRIKEILKNADADIIGLQEATPQWVNYISENFSEDYDIFCRYRERKVAWREAPLILCKKGMFDYVDTGYFWLSDTPWVESQCYDYPWNCKRMCFWVILKDRSTGKEFVCLNTHLGFGVEEQLKSVTLIKKTLDLIGVDDIIITGDFNMELDSPAYKEMTEHYMDANMLSGRYTGPTYHAYGAESEHIDYCFISDNSFEVASGVLLDDTFDGKYPSDHYGLLFDLHMK